MPTNTAPVRDYRHSTGPLSSEHAQQISCTPKRQSNRTPSSVALSVWQPYPNRKLALHLCKVFASWLERCSIAKRAWKSICPVLCREAGSSNAAAQLVDSCKIGTTCRQQVLLFGSVSAASCRGGVFTSKSRAAAICNSTQCIFLLCQLTRVVWF